MSMKSGSGMLLTRENLRIQRKPSPCATLTTTNPTRTDPGANPGFREERSATIRLSHATALTITYRG
jgi:hypothetical protein